jgi:hypothetical protein
MASHKRSPLIRTLGIAKSNLARNWKRLFQRNDTDLTEVRETPEISIPKLSSHEDKLNRTLADYETAPEERDFIDFVAKRFDPELYLEINSDVADAGMDPLKHWLDHGLKEGRRISPLVDVCCGDVATSFFCRKWTHYRWRETIVAVRTTLPISQEIMKQIINQARHDATVVAPGENAIANLRKFYAFDFATRDSLDVDGLFIAIPRSPDVLLITARLEPGPTGEFVANLVYGLGGAGHATQVIVTEQSSSELGAMNEPALLARLRKANILCWPDVIRDRRNAAYLWDICRDPSSGANLALLVNGLRPKAVVVSNGQMGLDMIRRFGRGLSQNSPLYRVRLGTPHDRFEATQTEDGSGDTPRFATLVMDNEHAAVTLRDHLLGLLP